MSLKHLYKSWRWQKLRKQQLLTSPLCVYCKPKPTLATVCDHVEPHRGDIGKFWTGRFQSLCKHCHDSRKKREENRGRPDLPIGPDGWPL
jgi:5-methylcytosine-specific restriction protein A